MDKKKLFKISAYSVILLSLVNFIALKFYWYFSIWYFDMLMHFWGGLCVGFTLMWLLFNKNPDLSFKFILKISLGVLVIGGLWEIFEILFNNIIAQNKFNALDSISDVFFDLSGGLCAILYLWKKLQK